MYLGMRRCGNQNANQQEAGPQGQLKSTQIEHEMCHKKIWAAKIGPISNQMMCSVREAGEAFCLSPRNAMPTQLLKSSQQVRLVFELIERAAGAQSVCRARRASRPALILEPAGRRQKSRKPPSVSARSLS